AGPPAAVVRTNAPRSNVTGLLKVTLRPVTIDRWDEPLLTRNAVTTGGVGQALSLIRTDVEFAEGLAVATSRTPPPLNSPTATPAGLATNAVAGRGSKVPLPRPNKVETELAVADPITRSGTPSRLTSPTTKDHGAGTEELTDGRKLPSPWPRSAVTAFVEE